MAIRHIFIKIHEAFFSFINMKGYKDFLNTNRQKREHLEVV